MIREDVSNEGREAMTEPPGQQPDAEAGPEARSLACTTVSAATIPARILVVDDRAENRELLQASLEQAEYTVLTAASGEEALAAVAGHRPDLILLDLMMPGLDGYEVCRRLKADPETAFIPLIVVTALQDLAHRLRGIELGADEFLTKPFNTTEVLTRVRALLRTKRLHDQVAAYNRVLEEKVTERTAALERALTDLREIDRIKSEFLANISHELRTPLTLIRGYLPALVQEEFGGLTPQQREVLDHVTASVDRLHRLIDDLLMFTTWETGQDRPCREAVAVATLIEAGGARALARAREKGVRVAVEVPTDLPQIWADVNALSRALGHVLENAVKFTPPRGTVTVTARRGGALHGPSPDVRSRRAEAPPHAPHASGECVAVTVHDDGVGIPPEALPRIFDRFYQVDGSSTREHGGTGLGLALTKRLVERHGGRIWAESAGELRGSTFVIVLPIGEPQE